MGRVILADLPDRELDKVLARTEFKRFTKWTVANAHELRRRLTDVRRDGYCITQDELEEGLDAVAVPVRIDGGRAVAALNCTAYSRQMDKRKIVKARLKPLMEAAEKVQEAVRQFPGLAHIFTAQPL